MKFKRKHRVKGKTVKHYKEWRDETNQYRISWRDEVYDVEVPGGFFACVRCIRSPVDRTEYWGFANKRGLYRTLKAAQKGCETSEKLWQQLMSIEGRGKVNQIRDLEARAMLKGAHSCHGYSAFSEVPIWVATKINPRLLEIVRC